MELYRICVRQVIKDVHISVSQRCCCWKCVLQRNHSIFFQHVCRDVSCVKCIIVWDRRICHASPCFSLSYNIHISRCPFLSDSFILSHSKKENTFPCRVLSSLTFFTSLCALHSSLLVHKYSVSHFWVSISKSHFVNSSKYRMCIFKMCRVNNVYKIKKFLFCVSFRSNLMYFCCRHKEAKVNDKINVFLPQMWMVINIYRWVDTDVMVH